MLKIAAFISLFIFISNWFQIITIISAIFNKGIGKKTIKDKWIYDTVLKKTGLRLLGVTLFNDERMYGMMAGLPFWPKMILSKGLYKNFNKNELEWVILHEAGHCVLWHNLEAMLIELSLAAMGIYLIDYYKLSFIVSIYLAIGLALICIQIIRWAIEYQADQFSIERVGNPNGVITAQEKFKDAKVKNLFNDEKSIVRFLLHWNISPSKRIEMAKSRLIR
jgi:Zn-dependent protease with chaperone function